MTFRALRSFAEAHGVLLILLAATALRIAALVQYGTGYDGDFADAQWYLASARTLAETGAFTLRSADLSAMMMPGFVWFLVPFVALLPAGAQLLGMKLAFIGLALLSVWLVYLLGKRLAGPWAGLVAAALLALSPASIYTGNLTLTENLFLPVVLLFTLLLWRMAEAPTWRRFLPLLAVFCAGVYVRETMLVLGLAAFAYLLVKRMPLAALARWAAIAAVVLALALTPWWVRNLGLFGEFVPTTTGGAYPFYEGTFQTFHPYGTGSFDGMGAVLEGVRGGEIERNEALYRAALDRIAGQWRTDPGSLLLRTLVTKPAAAWALPFYWDEVLGMKSWWVARIHALVAALGLLALGWAAIRGPKRAEAGFMLTVAAIMTVLVGVMLGLSRYVYPFMPYLYVAIGAAVVTLTARLKPRSAGTSSDTHPPAARG